MKSTQQLLDELGYTEYVSKDVIDEVPESTQSGAVEYFKLGRYVTDEELQKEYENRGLEPITLKYLASIMTDELLNEKIYIGTHWKDAKGNWCFAAFGRWDGERGVRVYRGGGDWDDGWWFAGVRKTSDLAKLSTSSEPLSLSEEEAIAFLKGRGYKITRLEEKEY